MRRTSRNGAVICFFINLVLNAELLIPTIILIVLHFVLNISLWWAIGAAVLYVLWIALFTFVLGRLIGSAKPDEPRKNKNPYSSKTSDFLPHTHGNVADNTNISNL